MTQQVVLKALETKHSGIMYCCKLFHTVGNGTDTSVLQSVTWKRLFQATLTSKMNKYIIMINTENYADCTWDFLHHRSHWLFQETCWCALKFVFICLGFDSVLFWGARHYSSIIFLICNLKLSVNLSVHINFT